MPTIAWTIPAKDQGIEDKARKYTTINSLLSVSFNTPTMAAVTSTVLLSALGLTMNPMNSANISIKSNAALNPATNPPDPRQILSYSI